MAGAVRAVGHSIQTTRRSSKGPLRTRIRWGVGSGHTRCSVRATSVAHSRTDAFSGILDKHHMAAFARMQKPGGGRGGDARQSTATAKSRSLEQVPASEESQQRTWRRARSCFARVAGISPRQPAALLRADRRAGKALPGLAKARPLSLSSQHWARRALPSARSRPEQASNRNRARGVVRGPAILGRELSRRTGRRRSSGCRSRRKLVAAPSRR